MKQNISSETYTVADVESYDGVANTKVTLPTESLKSYEGFTLDTTYKDTVLEANLALDGTTVLKVYYKRNTYKITINYNNSKTPQKVIEKVPYGATTLIHTGKPEWSGHTFTGWDPVPPTTMPTQDVEVTAQWDTKQYTVDFESNGGLEEIPSQALNYGSKVSEPPTPTKEGYVFGGWYSDDKFSLSYNFEAPVANDLTLYAKWVHSYTMSFNSNGGTEIPNQTVFEGIKPEAPKSPTREGYTFAGWFSDEGLTKGYNFATEIVTGDITLYAKWVVAEEIKFRVTFYLGGLNLIYQDVTKGGVAVPPDPGTQPGKTFFHWREKGNGKSGFDFTTPITRSYELYAAWVDASYKMSFISDGKEISSQTVVHNQKAKIPSAPTKEGHIFKGWYNDPTWTQSYDFNSPVQDNLVVYAKWVTAITVSFDSKGGPAVNSQTLEYNAKVAKPTNPQWAGYEFGDWYSDEDLTSIYDFETPVTGNITLYAKWTELFTVSFDYKDESGMIDKKNVPRGQPVSEPTTPTREVDRNFTLYAQWKPATNNLVIDDELVEEGDEDSSLVTPIMAADLLTSRYAYGSRKNPLYIEPLVMPWRTMYGLESVK